MRNVCAQSGVRRAAALICAGIVLACSAPARAVQSAVEGEAAQPADEQRPLHERQRAIRDRLQRLENRMLELARVLAETEPAKSERLRDTLDLAGRQRIKARLEQLVELLAQREYSDADRAQETVLTDLHALLDLLSSSLNELDRLREERKRLEQLKRRIRTLIDEQLEMLYRTQHARQKLQRHAEARSEPGGADPERANESSEADAAREAHQMLRKLEQMQREAERRADRLERDMQPQSEGRDAAPGAENMQQAGEHMRQAADRLGEQEAESAEDQQHGALDELQQALDQLDDALRQMRQEERAETLAALEARLRSLLGQEQRVRESISNLQSTPPAGWTRFEELHLAETNELQAQAIEDARVTVRILIDEGTTVIIPEMMRQMIDDMLDVAGRLERSDVSEATLIVLDDVIAVLEEILEAVERQRDRDAQSAQPPDAPPADGSQSRPLLPESAELKLMRSLQVRLNGRSLSLQRAAELAGMPAEAMVETFRRVAERQVRLAEQARQMNERK